MAFTPYVPDPTSQVAGHTWPDLAERGQKPLTASQQTLSVTSGAAVSFTAFSRDAESVFVDIETGKVYCTFDGSTPSSSNGHTFIAGLNFTWSVGMANAAKFIADSTTADITGSPLSNS